MTVHFTYLCRRRQNRHLRRSFVLDEPPLHAPQKGMLDHEDEWATLHFKLKDADWNYMNHNATVRTSANLAVIKNMLRKKHGPIANLNICKDEYLEKNELDGDMKTLYEHGIQGGTAKENAPITTLYYDFKPTGIDPQLLS